MNSKQEFDANDSETPNFDGLEFHEVEEVDFDLLALNDDVHVGEPTAIPQTAPQGNLFLFVFLVLFFGIWFLWLLENHFQLEVIDQESKLVKIGWPVAYSVSTIPSDRLFGNNLSTGPYLGSPFSLPYVFLDDASGNNSREFRWGNLFFDVVLLVILELAIIYCLFQIYWKKWIVQFRFSLRFLWLGSLLLGASFYLMKDWNFLLMLIGAVLSAIYTSVLIIPVWLLINHSQPLRRKLGLDL